MLAQQGLAHLTAQLEELGVSAPADLAVLTADLLEQAGISKVVERKKQLLLSSDAASPLGHGGNQK